MDITECYRDIEDLFIIGGIIYGENTKFVKSHGVKTPAPFWKVIIRGRANDTRAIAWLVPNTSEAKQKKLDDYLVTITEIEELTGEV